MYYVYVYTHMHRCIYMNAIAHDQHARGEECARGASDGLNVAAGLLRVRF